MAVLTKLVKRDFEYILATYNVGSYIDHKHIPLALGNTVYFLKTDKGKFILKIFEGSSLEFMINQIKLEEFLYRKAPVAENIRSKTGIVLQNYKKKYFKLQKYVWGRHPKKFSSGLVKDLAVNMAMLHKCLGKLDTKKIQIREGDVFEFMKMKCAKSSYQGFPLQLEVDKLKKIISRLNINALRKEVIHADILSDNLLVKNNKVVAIIDWDDVHRGFISYDIATFLCKELINNKSVKEKKIKLFLKSYQHYNKLNNEEKIAIYHFMKFRLLTSANWTLIQMKHHKDIIGSLDIEFEKKIKKYNHFHNFNLEKFLELF